MFELFTQTVMTIGRIETSGVNMLGTGFLVTNDGTIATTRHVVGNDDKNLAVLFPKIRDINIYQDTSDVSCQCIPATILEIDPFKDIALLKVDLHYSGSLPTLSSFDTIDVGKELGIFGFPHCTHGRRVLTFQKAEIGAKIILESNSVKAKYAVINTQARPGQSGSLLLSLSSANQTIVGMLIGAFIPSGGSISLSGINPHELHQTTHCISAEYIKAMLEGGR
ncbi:hypothetical protein AGMMS50230_18350 [Spirochaetia bacterium]|nr:hypothetical protein AGMMS50230_18350 [Spirochaetia bacterium]